MKTTLLRALPPALGLTALLMAGPSMAQAFGEGAVLTLEGRVLPRPAPAPGEAVHSTWLGVPGAGFLRLHLRIRATSGEAEGSPVRLRTESGWLMSVPSGSAGVESAVWTGLIPGDLVEVYLDGPPDGLPTVEIDRLAFEAPDRPRPLSVRLPDDRAPLFTFAGDAALIRTARSVGRLSLVRGEEMATCSGFLVSSRHFVTNSHCISEASICDTAVAIFGNVAKPDGSVDRGREYRCRGLVAADGDLDVAVLELEGSPGNEWGVLRLADSDPEQGQASTIVGHPYGRPMTVSRRGCEVTAVPAKSGTKLQLGHSCDTEPGNSGSPLLGPNLDVIGLHRAGFDPDSPIDAAENLATRPSALRTYLVEVGAVSPTP